MYYFYERFVRCKLGNLIRKIVEEENTTQRYIYEKLGIDKAEFQRKMEGNSFSIEELEAIAELFDYDVYVVMRKGDKMHLSDIMTLDFQRRFESTKLPPLFGDYD